MTCETILAEAAAVRRQTSASRTPADSLLKMLEKVDKPYRFSDRPDLARLVNWSSTRDAPIHRWLRYREAYSPELIDALKLGQRVLDPFGGCGSILLGSASKNRRSVGIDLNPLAAFAARVKTSPLTAKQKSQVEAFCAAFPTNLPAKGEPWLPDLSIAPKVFEPEILETLLRIRTAIRQAKIAKASKDFLKLCWIAILETVGSYYKEGNGIKYRNVQRKPGKYVPRPEGEWQLKRFGDDQTAFVLNAFKAHLIMMVGDTELWDDNWVRPDVVEGNALSLQSLVDGPFDSIIFSPPYANRFDYFESMKVELWFGEFVASAADVTALRKGSLRSHLGSDMGREKVRFDELEGLIDRMDRDSSSWRMGVPQLLRGYFSDIVEVLKQCRALLKGGACYVVVGNSAFGGTIIPSDSLTALAGLKAGFTDAEIWIARHLTVSPQQRSKLEGYKSFMRESIVVLRP